MRLRAIRVGWWLAWAAIGIGAAACGSGAAPAPSHSGAAAPRAAVHPSARPSGMPVLVRAGTATVAGKSTEVLTTAAGMTLYYFTPDSPTKVACTGHCTQIWPPLLAKSGTLALAPGLSGHLSTVSTALGPQVEYNGHPLYTYIRDTKPGQANGEGVLGKWFVATPGMKPLGR
ncbi:MAG: hypothetical protein K6U14_08680 [Firmicutes bacterium]|nr:hypothetical protein [Alicyclobacillaceae bacterium]MCL6497684.1 hypothetical protein [Bacillota bacterium]